MKTRKLIKRLFEASLEHNQKQENKLYQKTASKKFKAQKYNYCKIKVRGSGP